jgi:hypothetical protein
MKARLKKLENKTAGLEFAVHFEREEEDTDLEKLYPGKRVICFIREADNNDKSISCGE